MKVITLRKGETLKQAVQRLNRKMFQEWGRQGGKTSGKVKSEAAKKREAKKRGIRLFEVSTTIREI